MAVLDWPSIVDVLRKLLVSLDSSWSRKACQHSLDHVSNRSMPPDNVRHNFIRHQQYSYWFQKELMDSMSLRMYLKVLGCKSTYLIFYYTLIEFSNKRLHRIITELNCQYVPQLMYNKESNASMIYLQGISRFPLFTCLNTRLKDLVRYLLFHIMHLSKHVLVYIAYMNAVYKNST